MCQPNAMNDSVCILYCTTNPKGRSWLVNWSIVRFTRLPHMPHCVIVGFPERSRLIKCTTSQAWLKPHQPREIATLLPLLRPWPNLQIQGQPEDRKGKRVANLALSLQFKCWMLPFFHMLLLFVSRIWAQLLDWMIEHRYTLHGLQGLYLAS